MPRLPEKPRNAAEKVLAAFDQRRARHDDRHIIVLPDDCEDDALNMRLHLGLADSYLRETVMIEDEIQWELDTRDTKIEKLEQEKVQKEQELENLKRTSAHALSQAGLGAKAIAATLNLTEEQVNSLLK